MPGLLRAVTGTYEFSSVHIGPFFTPCTLQDLHLIYLAFTMVNAAVMFFSFIFDTTTPQKRATCVAYYIKGLALISLALLGSAIARMNEVFWSNYLLFFLMSGLLLIASSLFFLLRLREVQTEETIGYSLPLP